MAEVNELKLDFTLKELSCPAEDRNVPGASSTLELRDERLVCVEYPAVVSSTANMLETLGGERTVSNTFANPNRRLELRYRPQDPFCHPLCGNRFPSSNLLLRVRRRVRKKHPEDVQIQMDLLGVIGTTYKFQGMADFQCLAVHSEGGKDVALYDKIILRKIENQEFFEKPMQYFLPPAIFSRLDTPVDYFYRPDIQHNQLPISKKSFIGLNRVRRPNNALFVAFTDPDVPTECLEAAKLNWERVCQKDTDRESENQMRMMFESRPIWSRTAVKANINIHPDKLRLLLPVFAYYMVTGPWRSLWVRLGYDPRKIPESKKYQTLDYRFRYSSKHGYSLADLPVKAKRSALDYSLSITVNKTGPQPASVMDLPSQEGSSSSRDPAPISYQLSESSFIFREGMLPPHRQMFYQLCDLDVERIRKGIAQKVDVQVCSERDGWCAVGTIDMLRDMISGMIKKVIRAQMPAMPKIRSSQGESKSSKKSPDADEDEDEDEGENEDDGDDELLPSEGSENEMETEILDYV